MTTAWQNTRAASGESVEWHFTRGRWDEVNKVALPLKPPDGAEKASWPDMRRVLAVWTPVSPDGQYAFSSIQTQTLSGTSWKPAVPRSRYSPRLCI
jgi:hypothetical protein